MAIVWVKSSTWGGKRAGAGRPRGDKVQHGPRERHRAKFPVRLTLKASSGLPSLRRPDLFQVIRDSIEMACCDTFRILHYSVQSDHLHLIVEAADDCLSGGAQGISVRLGRRLNDLLGRRGRFWGDRYDQQTLKTPKDVHDAYLDVLMNHKRHQPDDAPDLDPCSSAAWFDGFRTPVTPPEGHPPVRRPRTWLGTTAWRRHGLLSPTDAPGKTARDP